MQPPRPRTLNRVIWISCMVVGAVLAISAFTYVGAVLLLGIAPLFVYCQMNIICPHCGKPVMVDPERTFLTGYTLEIMLE